MIFFNPLAKTIKLSLIAIFFLSFSLFNSSYAADAAKGEKLFKQSCASCHSVGSNKVVGPGLKDVESRWADKANLYKWIQNSAELIKAGDAYSVKIFEEYGKMPMTAFPQLKDADIDDILEFVKTPPAAPAADASKGKDNVADASAEKSTSNSNTIYIVVIVFLVILIFVFSNIRRSLHRLVNEKLGLPAPEEMSTSECIMHWMKTHKKWVVVITLCIFAYGGKVSWYWMKNIGVYEGYMPEQPIKYSHKLHAGQNKIDCQYCHTSAYKGKVAGVPSLNVCMNCHKFIQEGPVYGKEEIAKIYTALDYNPETQQYGPNQKPVRWVRVHNLPDHVYFNHSQHVVVGKVECQKCHGPIEQMDTVRQFSQLTMAWCVDCHRNTEVKTEGNAYYADLHKKLKEKYKNQKITVEKIGGLDCGKCHY